MDSAEQGPGRRRATWLRVEQVTALDHWCLLLRKAFPEAYGAYLVGSAITRQDYRDVDIRIVVPDEHVITQSQMDRRTLNMLLSTWGQQMTGLPIDCQVQSATESAEIASDGETVPIHARGIAVFPIMTPEGSVEYG